jgi:ABC-type branched-subunit amino acid transport system permease subunit
MASAVQRSGIPGFGRCLIAGIGAGIVAAVATVAAERVTSAPVPPPVATAWSAFIAGILGGLLYGLLGRVSTQPVRLLWIITLVLATIDSIFIISYPIAVGSTSVLHVPVAGLVVPIRQFLALVGIGHFGRRHFPAAYLTTDTALHYITAVAVSILVPLWAGKRR